MTDSQAINSSVLAEYLDVLKQMQASLAEIKKPSGTSIQEIAWTVHNDSGSMIRNLDALRALVAEQEQESASSPAFAVGDTVRRSDEYIEEFCYNWRTEAALPMTVVAISESGIKCRDKDGNFGTYRPSNLTLIRKANA